MKLAADFLLLVAGFSFLASPSYFDFASRLFLVFRNQFTIWILMTHYQFPAYSFLASVFQLWFLEFHVINIQFSTWCFLFSYNRYPIWNSWLPKYDPPIHQSGDPLTARAAKRGSTPITSLSLSKQHQKLHRSWSEPLRAFWYQTRFQTRRFLNVWFL